MRRLSVMLLTLCLALGCMAQQGETDAFQTASGSGIDVRIRKYK